VRNEQNTTPIEKPILRTVAKTEPVKEELKIESPLTLTTIKPEVKVISPRKVDKNLEKLYQPLLKEKKSEPIKEEPKKAEIKKIELVKEEIKKKIESKSEEIKKF